MSVSGIGFLDVPGTNMKYGMKAEYGEDYSIMLTQQNRDQEVLLEAGRR